MHPGPNRNDRSGARDRRRGLYVYTFFVGSIGISALCDLYGLSSVSSGSGLGSAAFDCKVKIARGVMHYCLKISMVIIFLRSFCNT